MTGIKKWIKEKAVESGYWEGEDNNTLPSKSETAGQASVAQPAAIQQPVSPVMPMAARDPEREKFTNIFFSALRRYGPKFFEVQELLQKLEKTISDERGRYASALLVINVSRADILKQIDAMMIALANEESTAVTQINASGEREISDKKMQVDNLSKRMEDLKNQLAVLEREKADAETSFTRTQRAAEETVSSIKTAAVVVQNELATMKSKIEMYCGT